MPQNKEYIERKEALRQIFLEAMGHDFDFNAEYRKIYISAKRAIKNIPAADVVEVVRCKDCENSRPLKRERLPESVFRKECVWCRRFNTGMLPDKYCSYGKRKMDKEE